MAYVQPTQSGTIVEFGAGWRTMATSLARAHPNRTIVVYQSSLLMWTFLRLRSALAGTSNLNVRREAFHEANLSPAAAIICFRLPQSAPLLEKKFHIELAPGTLVISRNFTLPGWSIQQSAKLNNRNKTRINTYTVHG